LWFDALPSNALETVGQKLGISDEPVWQLAAANFETFKAQIRACPQTLNYNDFAAENLALSSSTPLQAIVFDYDQFCLGREKLPRWALPGLRSVRDGDLERKIRNALEMIA
jgi:hypothetical protein